MMSVVNATVRAPCIPAGTALPCAMPPNARRPHTAVPTPVPATTMQAPHPMTEPATRRSTHSIAGEPVFRVRTVPEIAVGPQPTMSAVSAADPERRTVAGTVPLYATPPLAQHPPYTVVPTPAPATTMVAPQSMTAVVATHPTRMIALALVYYQLIVSEPAAALQPSTVSEPAAAPPQPTPVVSAVVGVRPHAGMAHPYAQAALVHLNRCTGVRVVQPATTTHRPHTTMEAVPMRNTHTIAPGPVLVTRTVQASAAAPPTSTNVAYAAAQAQPNIAWAAQPPCAM